jgi:H/ACA ribonucleoprotein complex subunit 3
MSSPRKIKRCERCKKYTLSAIHCRTSTKLAHPPKYSPEDKYAKYRRMEKGLI